MDDIDILISKWNRKIHKQEIYRTIQLNTPSRQSWPVYLGHKPLVIDSSKEKLIFISKKQAKQSQFFHWYGKLECRS